MKTTQGFYHLYGKDAKKHLNIISRILEYFDNSEYTAILPSIIGEYDHEDKNLCITYSNSSKPISIRSDITAQILEIYKHKTLDKAEKLFYLGDVIQNREFEVNHQFTQAGIEVLTPIQNITSLEDSIQASTEVINEILNILDKLEISEYVLILRSPYILTKLSEYLGHQIESLNIFTDINSHEIYDMISRKSVSQIEKVINLISQENVMNLDVIYKTILSPNFELLKQDIFSKILGEKYEDIFSIYCNIYKNIKTRLDSKLVCDFLNCNDICHYYNDVISFSILSNNIEIVSGGGYITNSANGALQGFGASIYVNNLTRT